MRFYTNGLSLVSRGDSLTLTILTRVNSLSANCHLSYVGDNKLYVFRLDSPMPLYPHGVKGEDGFYKVAGNKTLISFQDCGGPSNCGMGCSALVAKSKGDYDVCTAIGRTSNMDINIIDKNNPHIGVIVKMSSNGLKGNCSLSVSVICDPYGVQATQLKHPSGGAKVVHVRGKVWSWFGTFLIIVLCLFGAYLLTGAVYQYFSLGVRGRDVIPNLDFWTGLPQQAQAFYYSVSASVLHKFKGSSQGHRTSYSPVNF